MEIRVVRTLAEIEALKPQWEQLFRDSREQPVFCSFAWMRTAYASHPEARPLVVLVYSDTQQLIGVCPFAVRELSIKGFRFKALVHGATDRADYASFLVAPDVNHRLLFRRVIDKLLELNATGEWRLYSFDNFSESDHAATLFCDLLKREISGAVVRTITTPRLRLSAQFEEARKVANVKRRFAKLVDAAGVQVDIGRPVDEQLFESLVALHKSSFAGAAFNSREGRDFYAALIADTAFKPHIEISTIRVGEALIAAHFGFKAGTRVYYYVPMYDERYGQYGPGQYLIRAMLNHYREAGYEEFDFLRGGEDYKYQWMNCAASNFRFWGIASKAPLWLKALMALLVLRDTLSQFKASS
jgi:CelD/BcsL family acetyltransferase involved in cellulose biosynthesis